MLEIFDYTFMQRAFLAGIAVGIIAPLIGTFLVAKRYSLIADSLAHVSLAGVGFGLFLGLSPVLGALAIALAVAFFIERLRSQGRLPGEVALAMFMSSGLAVAIILMSVAGRVNVDLFSYLFGSITTVQVTDLWLILPLAVLVLALASLLYKELAYTAFDDEQAKVSGLPTKLINQALVMLTAITVVLSLRIVGGLLIGALMVIPVAAAMQIARSLRQTIMYAVGLGLMSVILGLFAAYYLNLPAGGAIVITALGFFLVAALSSKVVGRTRR